MILAKLKGLRSRPSSWGLVTEVSTLGMSLLTFVVVGESLGPAAFGTLAATLATIALLAPLLTASPEHVLVQRIAQDVSVGFAWKQGLGILLLVGPLVSLVMVVVAMVVSPSMSPIAVFLLSMGEVSFLGVARLGIRAHEAVDASHLGARIAVVSLLTRSLALVVFLFSSDPSIDTWVVLHLLASVVVAVYAHWSLHGRGEFLPRLSLPTVEDYKLGLPFALNAGPDGFLSNNDKMVLTGSGLEAEAGIYSAAYRVVSISSVPARSILRTRYASFFRTQNQEAEASIANIKSVLRATVPAGVLSGALLFIFAPVTRFVLGEDFSDSVDALRWLAFLPVVRSISTPCANVLTGTGRQRLRIAGTAGAAAFNFGLNLLFIPSFGWRAAAATTLIAEIVLLAWIGFHVFRKRPRAKTPAS